MTPAAKAHETVSNTPDPMIRATRTLRYSALPVAWLVLLGTAPALVAQNVSPRTDASACERAIKKFGPPRWGEKVRSPAKTRHVSPVYPPIPEGTTGGGPWIGDILIDARGRVVGVWTIRPVKLTPPAPLLDKAITDAVAKWRFKPAEMDTVPVAICWTVSVSVNLKAIRKDQDRNQDQSEVLRSQPPAPRRR
jgi:hypothetical protein